jgi:hypothetical protein
VNIQFDCADENALMAHLVHCNRSCNVIAIPKEDLFGCLVTLSLHRIVIFLRNDYSLK